MMKFLRTQMKWIMALIVVAFLFSTFLMYEGRSARRTSPGARNADGSMEDYEVAVINGRPLMRSELERGLRSYLSNYNTRSTISLDMAAIYQTVLDQAVLDSQMAKEIQEKGINVTDAEADRAMKAYADTYYPTREAFYQVLSHNGMKVDDYRRSVARQIANQQLMDEAVGEVVVSEDKAVEFYDTMKNLIYTKPEGFNLQVANFSSNQAAEEMRSKILAGEDWVKIASEDKDFASGDVINITKEPVFLASSAMRTGVMSVLDSLDVGQVSPVFSMISGDFAVAVKTEHVDSSITPYAEVSEDIRSMLRNQEERRRLSAWQSELIGKAQLVINDKSLFERPAVSEDAKPEEPSFVIEEVSDDEDEEEPEVVETETESEATPETQESELKQEVITEESKSADIASEPEVKAVEVPEAEQKPELLAVISEEPKPEAESEVKPEVQESKPESADASEPEATTSESKSKSKSEEKPETPEAAPEVKASQDMTAQEVIQEIPESSDK